MFFHFSLDVEWFNIVTFNDIRRLRQTEDDPSCSNILRSSCWYICRIKTMANVDKHYLNIP